MLYHSHLVSAVFQEPVYGAPGPIDDLTAPHPSPPPAPWPRRDALRSLQSRLALESSRAVLYPSSGCLCMSVSKSVPIKCVVLVHARTLAHTALSPTEVRIGRQGESASTKRHAHTHTFSPPPYTRTHRGWNWMFSWGGFSMGAAQTRGLRRVRCVRCVYVLCSLCVRACAQRRAVWQRALRVCACVCVRV